MPVDVPSVMEARLILLHVKVANHLVLPGFRMERTRVVVSDPTMSMMLLLSGPLVGHQSLMHAWVGLYDFLVLRGDICTQMFLLCLLLLELVLL